MPERGMCPSCGNQARLRADGTTGAHGGSPGAMLKGFVTSYHDNGHEEKW